jgi:serine/threonine-protein kinase
MIVDKHNPIVEAQTSACVWGQGIAQELTTTIDITPTEYADARTAPGLARSVSSRPAPRPRQNGHGVSRAGSRHRPLGRHQAAQRQPTHPDVDAKRRFLREARAVARLRHPNIITIYDVGEGESQPFIAMEYVAGQTLEEIVRLRQPLSVTRKLEIVEAICDGLAYAHGFGLVHRDIKPSNVLVAESGDVKILDFGIAPMADSSMIQRGGMLGTSNYMAPEQVNGGPVGPQADIFAVGALSFELLTLRRPFEADSMVTVLHRVLSEQPPPASSIMTGGNASLDAVIARSLQKNPQDRYANLNEMRQDLAAIRVVFQHSADATITPPTHRS